MPPEQDPSVLRRHTQDSGLTWHVYVALCGDKTLYTGVTNDLDRRFKAHNSGKASKYTRSHLPVRIVHQESFRSKSRAFSREAAIKKLSRPQKLALIENIKGSII